MSLYFMYMLINSRAFFKEISVIKFCVMAGCKTLIWNLFNSLEGDAISVN